MSFVSSTQFIHSLVAVAALPSVVSALPQTCQTAATPSDCLTISNSVGEPACTWLMLKGRCTDAGGRDAHNSPNSCCASKASSSSCQHHTDDLRDGMCNPQSPDAYPLISAAAPSLDEMSRMLHVAFAVYCPAAQVNGWSCGEHCDAVSGITEPQYVFNSKFQTAAFVAWDDAAQSILVVFRGTDNDSTNTAIKNWASNLDFFKTSPLAKYPNAEVHKGFWGVWEALKQDVVPLVQKAMSTHPNAPVRVAGHSLGGAVATNAAVDMKVSYGWATSVVNFGSPRTGDHEYHNVIKAEVPMWRITHHADIVPHVPPESFGFFHGATEVYFAGESGLTFKVCDGSGEDPSCSNACASSLACTSVADHLKYLDITMSCSAGDVIV